MAKLCPKCGGCQRREAALVICLNCGRTEERPAIPRDQALQRAIDRQLSARSAESRALSCCDTCWTAVAPGTRRCGRCQLKARLAAMPEGERAAVLAKAGLLAL